MGLEQSPRLGCAGVPPWAQRLDARMHASRRSSSAVRVVSQWTITGMRCRAASAMIRASRRVGLKSVAASPRVGVHHEISPMPRNLPLASRASSSATSAGSSRAHCARYAPRSGEIDANGTNRPGCFAAASRIDSLSERRPQNTTARSTPYWSKRASCIATSFRCTCESKTPTGLSGAAAQPASSATLRTSDRTVGPGIVAAIEAAIGVAHQRARMAHDLVECAHHLDVVTAAGELLHERGPKRL